MLSLVYWLDVYLMMSAVVFGGEQDKAVYHNITSVKKFEN